MHQHANRSGYKLSFVITLAIVTLLISTIRSMPASAQGTSGDFEATDCDFDLGLGFISLDLIGYTCGFVTVPEQHSKPDGSTIRLPVAVLKTNSDNPEPDPLFLAQGGPGGDTIGVFTILADGAPVAENRDIVVFNQRGTRYAEPDLQCEEEWEATKASLGITDEEELTAISESATENCHQRLINEGIDLSAYASLENAADIDIIRHALGYESYNFYGVSYGTLLGLHLINLQPPALRSVILDSVVAPQISFALEVGATENRAYDEYFGFCEADAICHEMYPNLEARLTAVLEQLDENPIDIRLTDPEDGKTYDDLITGEKFRSIIFLMFYLGDFYAVFPRVVADAEAGDFKFIETLYPLFAFDRTFSTGMYWSVVCAEEHYKSAAPVDTAGLRTFIKEGVASHTEELIEACDQWDVQELSSSVNDPVFSDTPTLLLSGRFDPITPPAYATEAAKTLSTSYNIVNPIGAHGNVFPGNDCTAAILSDFVNNPRLEPDTSCLDTLELTPIVPLDAILIPDIDKITGLKIGHIIKLGALTVFALLLLVGVFVWPLAWIVRKLRKDERAVEAGSRSFYGRLSTALTGVLILTFIGLFIFNSIKLMQNAAMLTYGAFPGSSRWIFVFPLIAILLAVVAVIYQVRSWRVATLAGRFYHGLMIISLLGVVMLTFLLRFIEPLFSG